MKITWPSCCNRLKNRIPGSIPFYFWISTSYTGFFFALLNCSCSFEIWGLVMKAFLKKVSFKLNFDSGCLEVKSGIWFFSSKISYQSICLSNFWSFSSFFYSFVFSISCEGFLTYFDLNCCTELPLTLLLFKLVLTKGGSAVYFLVNLSFFYFDRSQALKQALCFTLPCPWLIDVFTDFKHLDCFS